MKHLSHGIILTGRLFPILIGSNLKQDLVHWPLFQDLFTGLYFSNIMFTSWVFNATYNSEELLTFNLLKLKSTAGNTLDSVTCNMYW